MYAITRRLGLVFVAAGLLCLSGLSPVLADEGNSESPRRHRRPQDLKAILGDRIAGTLGRDESGEALPPRAPVAPGSTSAPSTPNAKRRSAPSRNRGAPGNAAGGQGGASRGSAGALSDAFGIDYQPTARAGNRSQGGGSSSATSAASGSPAAAKAPSAASGEDSAEAARRRDIAAREARRRAQAAMEARKSEAIRKTLRHLRMAENRERSMIRLAERNRQDSGWFGGMNRFVTGSDPYQIDIDNARQKLNLLQMTRRELQEARRAPDWQTQIDKLNIGRRRLGMREIDPRTGLESDQAPRPSSINGVDTDQERYRVEQEAISTTQSVVVNVGTAVVPIGAVGNGGRLAAQGLKAAVTRGAVVGATFGATTSGVENLEAYTDGRVSGGRALGNVAKASGTGAAFGAALGGGGNLLGRGASALRNGSSGGRAGPQATARQRSGPMGSKRSTHHNSPHQRTRNTDVSIGGRRYTGHAQDSMQNRGLTPTVVENTIRRGTKTPDPIPGRIRHYEPKNNITVITEGGDVITVIPGRR